MGILTGLMYEIILPRLLVHYGRFVYKATKVTSIASLTKKVTDPNSSC